jgi:glucokinase
MAEAIFLALDVSNSKTLVGLCSADGRVLQTKRLVRTSDEAEGYCREIRELVRELRQEFPEAFGRVQACGVAFGGPVDREGRILSMHVPGWEGVALGERIAEWTARPVWVENDARCGALGEWTFGAGRGCTDLVFMTHSTGMGGGIISGGRLLRGARGLAGELGHFPVRPEGPPCGCGGRGCLEVLCSGLAIARRAGEALAASPEAAPILARYARPDGTLPGAREVFLAAAAGDAVAAQVLQEVIADLGRGLAGIFNALDPQRILLGGGVPLAGEALFRPLRQAMQPYVMASRRRDFDVRPAALGEYAVLLGAAVVARQRGGEVAENQRI